MAQQIQVRRDTAANWTSADPILAQGEMGFEVDTNKGKFGDGTTAWTSLPYFGGSSLGTVTSVAALTLGTTGTDLSSTVANSTSTPVITLNVPTASASNRGALSASDWTAFNAKEDASNKATDFSTVNNTLYPTVQATKTYADGLVAGLLDYRGGYDASVNTFPTTGGSGTAGAILKGDMFIISVAGTLGGTAVQIGDSLISSVDTPGQTASNWNILEANISYVPEDVANKTDTMAGNTTSSTKYLSSKGVYDWATATFATPASLSAYLPLVGATYTTTTGNGLALTTSTLTTGNLVSLSSTGTGAGSNTQTVLNIATSGANGTSSQTTYGAYVTNTHTGTTSTNVGLYVSASGATNNYGLIVASGNVGIGTTAPPTNPKLAVVSGTITGSGASDSTIQLRHATENVGHSTAIEFTFGNGNNSYCGSRIVGETANAGGGNLHFQTGSSSLGTYSTKMYIAKAGNVGIGTTSPTAMLHIKAGTASANTAPLKFTTGTNLTTAEAGAMEFTTDDFYLTGTTGATRKTIRDLSYRAITAARTLDGSDELVNCTANTFAVTLPTAVGFNKQYTIKNTGTGIITIATTSSQTIDGVASGVLTLVQWDSIILRSDGANWIRVM